jgi:RimJ/RimL family protein N-acetyltransferase
MNIVIETERLVLRTFTIDDAPLIFALNRDPEVTRFTFDPVTSMEQAQLVLEKTILPQYKLYQYGRWAVHQRSDLEFAGWCGLKSRPEQNEIDLGYRFRRKCWGMGYATEAALASIHYGFTELGLNRIVGRAVVDNHASVRVLEKCGMQYVGEEMLEGHLHKTYEIFHPSIRFNNPSKKPGI